MERKALSEVLEKEGIYKECCDLGYQGSVEELSEEVIKILESKEFSELTDDDLEEIAGGRNGCYSISKRLAAALVSSVVALGVSTPQGYAAQAKQKISTRLKNKFWSTPKSKMITSGVLTGVPLTVLLGIISAGGAGVLISQLVKKNKEKSETLSSKDSKDTSKENNSTDTSSSSEESSHDGDMPNDESSEQEEGFIDGNSLAKDFAAKGGTILSGLTDSGNKNNDTKNKEILSVKEFPSMAAYTPNIEAKGENPLVTKDVHSFEDRINQIKTEIVSNLGFTNIQAEHGGKEKFFEGLKSVQASLNDICDILTICDQHRVFTDPKRVVTFDGSPAEEIKLKYKGKEYGRNEVFGCIKQIVEENPFLFSSKILDKKQFEDTFKDSKYSEARHIEVDKLFVDASYKLATYWKLSDEISHLRCDESLQNEFDKILFKFTLMFAEISNRYYYASIEEGKDKEYDTSYLDYAIQMMNYSMENNPKIMCDDVVQGYVFDLKESINYLKRSHKESDAEYTDRIDAEKFRNLRFKMESFSHLEERNRSKNDEIYKKHIENINKTLENTLKSEARAVSVDLICDRLRLIYDMYDKMDTTEKIEKLLEEVSKNLNGSVEYILQEIDSVENAINTYKSVISEIDNTSKSINNPGLKRVLELFSKIISKHIELLSTQLICLKGYKDIYTSKNADFNALKSKYESKEYDMGSLKKSYVSLMNKFNEDISKVDTSVHKRYECHNRGWCGRAIMDGKMIINDAKTYELFEEFDFLCKTIGEKEIQSAIDNITNMESLLPKDGYGSEMQILKSAYENFKQINTKITPCLEQIKCIQDDFLRGPNKEFGSWYIRYMEKYAMKTFKEYQVPEMLDAFKKCDKEIDSNTKELDSVANKAKEASEKVLVKGKIELIHKIFKLIDNNSIDLNKIEWKDEYKEDIEKLLESLPVDKLDTDNVTRNGWIVGEGKAFENAAQKRKGILKDIGNSDIRETVKTALEDSKYLARFIKLVIKSKASEWSSKSKNNLLWNYDIKSGLTMQMADLYVNINYMIRLSLLRYANGYNGPTTFDTLQMKELYELSKNLGTLFDAYDEGIIVRNI